MKKTVRIDQKAARELRAFPADVYVKFTALFELLEEKGKLELPFAKKLRGQEGLFEIRVSYGGQWRAVYAYVFGNIIVILSAFRKKSQKTPEKELMKANSQIATGTTPKSPGRIKDMKRTIAKILTIQNQKKKGDKK